MGPMQTCQIRQGFHSQVEGPMAAIQGYVCAGGSRSALRRLRPAWKPSPDGCPSASAWTGGFRQAPAAHTGAMHLPIRCRGRGIRSVVEVGDWVGTAVHCFQHTADLMKPVDKLAHAGDNHVVRHMHQRLVPSLAFQLVRCKSAAAAACSLPVHTSLVHRHLEHC